MDSAAKASRMAQLGPRLAYASGNFAKSLQWNSMEFLYLYYLTDILGLPAAIAGLLVFLSLVWDAVIGPVIGFVFDRHLGGTASYARALAWGAPVCALAYVALFSVPAGGASTLAFVFAGCIAFRTAYALVDIPHNAMLASLTDDRQERAVLAAWRFCFSAGGSIVLSLLIARVLDAREQGDPRAVAAFAWSIALIYTLVMAGCARWSPAGRHRAALTETPDLRSVATWIRGNRNYLLLLGVCLASSMLVPVFGKLALHYSNAWLGSPALAPRLLLLYAISQVAAQPVWTWVAGRTGKRRASLAAHLMLMVVVTGFVAARSAHLLWAEVSFVLCGFATGGVYMLNWAMLPDAIEQGGPNRSPVEAFAIGFFLFILKIGSGVGMLLVGWALALADYQPEPIRQDGAAVLPVAMALAPLLGAAASMLLLTRMKRPAAPYVQSRS